jgi:hypothetical protein
VFVTPTFQIVGLCKRQYYRIPSCAMRGARCWHGRTSKATVKSRWSSPRFSRCDALLQADALLQTGCSCFLPKGGKPRARAPLMRRVQTGATTWGDTPTTSGGGIQEMIRVLHKHKGDDRSKGVGGFRAWFGGSGGWECRTPSSTRVRNFCADFVILVQHRIKVKSPSRHNAGRGMGPGP